MSDFVNLSGEQIAALAAAAVGVFWMVGAYNRLIALRNAMVQAWAKVDDALRMRAQAAQPLLQALREPLAAEQGALDMAQAALADAGRAAVQMSARPVAEARAAAWVAAEAALAAAASRVFALLEQAPQAREAAPVAAGAAAWRESQSRLAFARQLFNDAAQAYDEAIALFPTRLLAPMFGFAPAGRI